MATVTYPQRSSLAARSVKNLPAMQLTRVLSLGGEDPLEERMATHSSILAWGILWTGEPGGSSPRGHRVRDDRSIEPQSTGDALPGFPFHNLPCLKGDCLPGLEYTFQGLLLKSVKQAGCLDLL